MPRIVHIGVGNFHRAHQAWYTAQAGDGWSITGVVMRNAALFDELSAQNGEYALGIRGADGLAVQRIRVHDELLLASENSAGVINAIAQPETQIITLTITEKGFCLHPDTGTLNLAHPDIAADLASTTPRSAIGLLAHGLARRHSLGAGPVTVISCDNMSENSSKLGAVVAAFAQAAGLAQSPSNRFANSMVDRITPATRPAIAAEISEALGANAPAPVLTEGFSDWVIEDNFAGPRPNWQAAGAEIVPDVAPYEARKLRLLNTAHSYLAYAGQLAGHAFAHEAIADERLRQGVNALWVEAAETLPDSLQAGLPAYRDALIARFMVPEMRHALAQIAMDGSLKLRERIVPIIAARGAENSAQSIRAMAAWAVWLRQGFTTGANVSDPNADALREIFAQKDALGVALAKWFGLPGIGASLAQEITALSRQ